MLQISSPFPTQPIWTIDTLSRTRQGMFFPGGWEGTQRTPPPPPKKKPTQMVVGRVLQGQGLSKGCGWESRPITNAIRMIVGQYCSFSEPAGHTERALHSVGSVLPKGQ